MPRTSNPKIYTFGDTIPSGHGYYVSYNVKGIPGGMLVGPFQSVVEAEFESADIKGYEGVSNVKVVPRSEIK